MASVPLPFIVYAMKTDGDHEENNLVTVFVAYEDFAAGIRAMAMLKRVDNRCDQPGQLLPIMWRFDVLSDASFFELAVSEALAADIIVIATRKGKGLPQRIKDWIARWLLLKQRRPLALVATLDYRPVKASSKASVLPYLAKLARFGKLQFFANHDGYVTGVELANLRG
jgi:hypothetical protein